MSHERLNGLATLCIEKRLLNKIDIDTIIDDFASKNVRRKFWGSLIYIQIILYEYCFCSQLLISNILYMCVYILSMGTTSSIIMYKGAQNFSFVLGQRKLRTGPALSSHSPGLPASADPFLSRRRWRRREGEHGSGRCRNPNAGVVSVSVLATVFFLSGWAQAWVRQQTGKQNIRRLRLGKSV